MKYAPFIFLAKILKKPIIIHIHGDYLNEEYNLEIPKSEAYETLGGFIIEHTENIPSENDKIVIKGFEITVFKMRGAKIEEVYLRILQID